MFNRKALTDILIMVMTIAMVVVNILFALGVGYQLGFATAKNLVENSSLGELIRTPDDIRTIVGTVAAVAGDSITLHTVSNNPFDDLLFADRTVLVDSTTKIVVQTSPGVFKNDLASIKVGDVLLVTTATNIKSLKTFTAELIYEQMLNDAAITVTVDEE